jgi:hypothetical protein
LLERGGKLLHLARYETLEFLGLFVLSGESDDAESVLKKPTRTSNEVLECGGVISSFPPFGRYKK